MSPEMEAVSCKIAAIVQQGLPISESVRNELFELQQLKIQLLEAEVTRISSAVQMNLLAEIAAHAASSLSGLTNVVEISAASATTTAPPVLPPAKLPSSVAPATSA